jgi:SAM-dependent methyltransferase
MSAPSRPKQDSSEVAFWEQRYRQGVTPWDYGAAPPGLDEWIGAHPVPRRVLIPGCGAAYEVKAFAARGWDVLAIDYSPAAVEAAQAALGVCAATVRLADFFADDFGTAFPVIYERAFLCALPPRMGAAYRDRVHALLADDGVLAGYFFVASETDRGPPFAISATNLKRLLGSRFELIEDRPSPDRRTVFGDSQRWQVWQKHQVCGL